GRELGFDRQGVFQVSWDTISTGYKDERLASLFSEINEKVSSLPGVLSASLASCGLMSGSIYFGSIIVEGDTGPPDKNMTCHFDRVGTNFFETVGMPVLSGRGFRRQDEAPSPQVAVINEAAVRRYFEGTDPIGKRFYLSAARKDPIEVVGVVKDAMYIDLRGTVPAMIYT